MARKTFISSWDTVLKSSWSAPTSPTECATSSTTAKLRGFGAITRWGGLAEAFIAVAATGDTSVSSEIAHETKKRNVLLNVVEDTRLCTFIAPSVARRGEVTVATSTGGASPALARKFREELTRSRILEYADLAPLLSDARNELKSNSITVDPDHWQKCLTEELLDAVQAGRVDEARQALMTDLLSELPSTGAPSN